MSRKDLPSSDRQIQFWLKGYTFVLQMAISAWSEASNSEHRCKQLPVDLNKDNMPSYPAEDLQISLPTAFIWNTSSVLYCNV